MKAHDAMYRSAVGIALAAAFMLAWLSLGVGIIGRDGDPANAMYFAVLAVGIAGALIARFQPLGMARALVATALAQTSVALIALVGGLGRPWSGPLELSALNGFFVALFLGSAWLFRRAAQGRLERGVV
jgi:O-antigen/teichoic acid export membrane protein